LPDFYFEDEMPIDRTRSFDTTFSEFSLNPSESGLGRRGMPLTDADKGSMLGDWMQSLNSSGGSKFPGGSDRGILYSYSRYARFTKGLPKINSGTESTPVQPDPTHAQVEISIKYTGNMHASISTSLIVNQPTPGFMVLPVILSVTGCDFQASAVVAFLGVVRSYSGLYNSLS
jgi:Maintenance of mitochondrial morphology protein 1